ncbi:hypothetical protein Bpfe_008573 [Biomphalaria pfeifferi]|uniref:Uncharacterized protein n=1 Tax=Biomphalaria pfeifferi TaxID=112525 RepID=A0AAD8BWV8_BIOPF|nr:hypothetical protein Bpfe_008573 [Biomphalaria pfeifferi]
MLNGTLSALIATFQCVNTSIYPDTATICLLFSKEFAPSARSFINTFNSVYFKKKLFFFIPKSLSIGWMPQNSLAMSETLPMKLPS